jgi:hypothetical protein
VPRSRTRLRQRPLSLWTQRFRGVGVSGVKPTDGTTCGDLKGLVVGDADFPVAVEDAPVRTLSDTRTDRPPLRVEKLRRHVPARLRQCSETRQQSRRTNSGRRWCRSLTHFHLTCRDRLPMASWLRTPRPVRAIVDCRRAGRADGRQEPRRSGVHRHARCSGTRTGGLGCFRLRWRSARIPMSRSRRALLTTCATLRRRWRSVPGPT